MRLVILVLVSAVIGVLGCSSGSSYPTSSGGGGGGHTISLVMAGTAFSPSPDTVAVGSTVTWTNNDGFGHTVTSSPSSAEVFNSSVASGASYSRTFNTAGTFAYYCSIHGTPTSGMRGTIVVK